jgi:DNA-binding transcriptional LysR family regulator
MIPDLRSAFAAIRLRSKLDTAEIRHADFAELEPSARPEMRFNLADLKLFVYVVEAGSITGGAERLNLALAAASTRIRNMEAVLGAPLLHRQRQSVVPTQAGHTLVRHTRILLRQAERMHGDLGQCTQGISGQVRLLSNSNALTELLAEPLSAFLAANPRVNIGLEERLSDEVVAAVADGAADIGIVAGTVAMPGLETLPFRTDRLVIVVAPGHPLAATTSIAFAELLDCDFIGLDRTSALQRFLSEKAERLGRRLKLRVKLRSFDAVCRFVECDVGVGIVPAITARRLSRTMAIRRVELADAWAVRELRICLRRAADLPIYARQLVQHLAAERRDETAAGDR